MERFAFIHGSSVGQSTFIPSDSPTSVCNDIANKYFQGRTLRQKESAAKQSLFVELYKSPKGDNYSVYSFVNNNCRGANGRDGQYLALTIICKNVYFYPEPIFRMLFSAYKQMFASGKIIGYNKEGEEQYIIPQFEEEKEYLSIFLKKIEDVFDNISNGLGKAIDSNNHIADYDSWYGKKVNIDSCNSMATFESFCDIGRLYISEEYESSEEKIKVLEEYIKKLEKEKTDLEHLSSEAKRSEKSKVYSDVEALKVQIKEKEKEIDSLTNENKNYKTTITTVRTELEKYAKVSKPITDIQGKTPQYQSKSKKDIIQICLLLIILILTILSSLMNFAFSRDIQPFTKDNKEMRENAEAKQNPSQSPTEDNQKPVAPTILEISSLNIEFEASGGDTLVTVTTDGEWEEPTAPKEWVKIAKSNDGQLSIVVECNAFQDSRECFFMVRTGDLEKQIRISQKGQTVSAPIDYGIVVKDSDRNILKEGSNVYFGQVLVVTATNPSRASKGFGWKFDGCRGDDQGRNVKEVHVKITGTSGTAIIEYGDLNDGSKRQKFRLKIQPVSDEASSDSAGGASKTATEVTK